MARVFRGELQGGAGFRKPAAVKVVLPGIGAKAGQLRRQLLQEARVGALLNHPNIVQTFDCGELDGYPFIAMELVEGVGLQELVQARGRLPPGVALDIASQVAAGLHHAHTATHEGRELRVIHRDVKPSNILIRGDGVAKVVDFGIAKAAVDDALSTSTGMTKGTPAYMSPEQLAAEVLDARSDVFALGAVLYYLLWGRTLFSGQSITEVMLRIIQVDETLAARGVFAEAEDIVPGLGDALAKMLAKDANRRYPNAGVASKVLADLRAGLPEHPMTADLVTEYLEARAAGVVFGAASDSPGDAPRVVAEKLAEGDITSRFRQRVEEAREGGVAWIESAVTGSAEGDATRLVPSMTAERPPEATAASGLSDLSLSDLSGWVDGEAQPGIALTRAMPSKRSRDKRRESSEELDWERRRRTARRRLVMSSFVLALVMVSLAVWGVFDREPTVVVSNEQVAVETEDTVAALNRENEAPIADREVAPRAPAVRGAAKTSATPEVAEDAAGGSEMDGVVDSEPLDGDVKADKSPVSRRAELLAAVSGSAGRLFEDEKKELNNEDLAVATGDFAEPEAAAAPSKRSAAAAPLRMSHRPFQMATVGTSKTVVVYVAGPDDPTVVVHWGPKGAADRTVTLERTGTGVWEGLIPIRAELRDAGGLVYWVVVTHPETTPRRVQSGSPAGPHTVTVY